jgi:hypothetical protein
MSGAVDVTRFMALVLRPARQVPFAAELAR